MIKLYSNNVISNDYDKEEIKEYIDILKDTIKEDLLEEIIPENCELGYISKNNVITELLNDEKASENHIFYKIVIEYIKSISDYKIRKNNIIIDIESLSSILVLLNIDYFLTDDEYIKLNNNIHFYKVDIDKKAIEYALNKSSFLNKDKILEEIENIEYLALKKEACDYVLKCFRIMKHNYENYYPLKKALLNNEYVQYIDKIQSAKSLINKHHFAEVVKQLDKDVFVIREIDTNIKNEKAHKEEILRLNDINFKFFDYNEKCKKIDKVLITSYENNPTLLKEIYNLSNTENINYFNSSSIDINDKQMKYFLTSIFNIVNKYYIDTIMLSTLKSLMLAEWINSDDNFMYDSSVSYYLSNYKKYNLTLIDAFSFIVDYTYNQVYIENDLDKLLQCASNLNIAKSLDLIKKIGIDKLNNNSNKIIVSNIDEQNEALDWIENKTS